MNQPLPTFIQPQNTASEISIQMILDNSIPRGDVEGFIAGVFDQAYGAKISHFMPQLMSMQRNGKIEAALGMNVANDKDALFLECYLEGSIEQALAKKFQRPIYRQKIVEVGNLAAVPAGAARYLFIAMTGYLWGCGMEWAVFTAVPRVINSFAKLGIELQPVAMAHYEQLPTPRDAWGSYYQNNPEVVVGDVAQSVQRIQVMLSQKNDAVLQNIWHAAVRTGEHSRQQGVTVTGNIL